VTTSLMTNLRRSEFKLQVERFTEHRRSPRQQQNLEKKTCMFKVHCESSLDALVFLRPSATLKQRGPSMVVIQTLLSANQTSHVLKYRTTLTL